MYDFFAVIVSFVITFFGGAPSVVAANDVIDMPSPKLHGSVIDISKVDNKNRAVPIPEANIFHKNKVPKIV